MENAVRFDELPDRVGLVTFDQPGKKVNVFSAAILAEWSAVVDQLERRPDLAGLLVRSGKPGQFIAGADLAEMLALATADTDRIPRIHAALDVGRDVFNRLSRLPYPTVGLIDGPCVGGGAELALALDDRIVSDNPKTRIGLPEVKVRLMPGWGGTQRLPRLIGMLPALEMILDGELVTAARAVERGLASAVVAPESLLAVGVQRIAELQQLDWRGWRERRRQPVEHSSGGNSLVPDLIADDDSRPQVRAAALAVVAGAVFPLETALRIERELFALTLSRPEAAAAIEAFFAR